MSMIINHNLSALNTYNKLSANNGLMNKSLEKLSSGYRINTAADDAAGLAISEKMRGQIRGLDQAKSNSQDAISMTQTAEGALDETTSILQRMRELAVKASTDTLTDSNRVAVQDEIDALTSEINRIGNTTSFNTKSLLKGDGQANLDATSKVTDGNLASGATNHTDVSQATTLGGGLVAADNGKSATWTINGQQLKVTFVQDSTLTAGTAVVDNSSITGNSVTVRMYDDGTTAVSNTDAGNATAAALSSMILQNSTLKNNFSATAGASGLVTVAATSTGASRGKDGNIADVDWSAALATAAGGGTAAVGTTTYVQASKQIDLSSVDTDAEIKALVGQGMTINGKQIEFYNANDGAYTGDAIGVNISTALAAAASGKDEELVATIVNQVNGKIAGVTLGIDATNTNRLDIIADNTKLGEAGNTITVKDGGVQEQFKATFQIGANTGQTMSLSINDMRSKALTVSSTTAAGTITVKDSEGKDVTATYKAVKTVTDGTSDTSTEYSLDLSTADKATAAISVIDQATSTVSAERSKMGAVINRLEHTINNLTTSSENLNSAESNIRDVDMASEMATYTNKSVLNQAATAMLAKANQQPQQVLTLLQG